MVLPHSPQTHGHPADTSPNCRFEILNPAKRYPITLQAETEKERNEWVSAIQNAISASLNAQYLGQSVDVVCLGVSNSLVIIIRYQTKRTTQSGDQQRPLAILQKVPGNTLCADCDFPG